MFVKLIKRSSLDEQRLCNILTVVYTRRYTLVYSHAAGMKQTLAERCEKSGFFFLKTNRMKENQDIFQFACFNC